MIEECLKKVVSRQDLEEKEAYDCMMEMVSGSASDVHMAALLSALATKGESISEITGFVRAMRQVSIKVSVQLDEPLVDTCGTGGDSFKTFNVSTIAAIIAAANGVAIAKHGNRAVSSKCGGADILEAVGVNINGKPEDVEACLEKTGMGFMFAPNFHPATKHVMPVRRKLGIRTVFNVLGPLTSPANADIHLMGVFDPEYVESIANVLKNLGVKRAMVLHGFDDEDNVAMDEISIIGKTKVAILDGGEIKVFQLQPNDLGLELADKKFIMAPDTLEENMKIAMDVLDGKRETAQQKARMDICLANAGAILFLADKTSDLKTGVDLARKTVQNGDAKQKLDEFIAASNC
ncbi:anthranilate phosphoribosyltransferase [Methanobacterium petrolearium]|uniref:anthranilate phosphoribosyltransferase n=1 Tax=Methanobacterium petrolearium TaxID=710190 RepID=UPI001AE4EA81|nr:anthranilate phosphoribosyltransferase [Methanobacterium petrolearium]MBP1946865.1 anthranilate phosphoribosyltransferase [Methanobacterium petrolearium]BDZ70479.1 anthranilate phosphoribosyltransferase [Methanobacterium petrolearium]